MCDFYITAVLGVICIMVAIQKHFLLLLTPFKRLL